MKGRLILMLAISIAGTAIASPLTPQSRQELMNSMVPSCIKAQTENPANANVPAGLIKKFCNCMANETANNMTQEQADYIEATNDPSPMIKATVKAQQICVQQVFG